MGRAMYGLHLPFQIILISLIGQLRSVARPVVTFNPDSNKILVGQSITMTCNVEPPASNYHWYRNNIELYTKGKTTTFSVQTEYSGDYKCRTSTGDTSEVVTLSVMDGPVILQAPLYVYEGDNISLQCFSPSKAQTIFYRNNQTVQKYTTNYDLLPVNYTELTATYRCSKQVLITITKTYSADPNISYSENTGTIPVTLKPNWNKLLTGDSITMICYEGYNNPLTYHWVKNGKLVSEEQTYTITSAQVGDSGIYQCRTDRGYSLQFSLEVSDGPLVLQAPIFVYRGRDLNLKCHSRPEYSVLRTTYYKGNDVISRPLHYHSYITVYNRTNDLPGRYRCEKVLSRDEYVTYTDEVSLHVRDLFSKPNITTMLYPMTEGDNMTLTCKTSLSPLRQGTQLQFAFYRGGLEVQKFSSSHQYEIQSAQLNDFGNYFCEVRTPSNSVIKRSEEFYIQMQGETHKTDSTTVNIIRLALSGCVLFLGCVFLIYHIKTEIITPSKK